MLPIAPRVVLGFLFFTQDIPPVEIQKPLPVIEVRAQDIVDVFTEYTIIFEINPVMCRSIYGLTDFETHTITVCANYDLTTRRKTLLHELLHVLYWKRGVYTGGSREPEIEAQAQKLFKQFYGVPEEDGL